MDREAVENGHSDQPPEGWEVKVFLHSDGYLVVEREDGWTVYTKEPTDV